MRFWAANTTLEVVTNNMRIVMTVAIMASMHPTDVTPTLLHLGRAFVSSLLSRPFAAKIKLILFGLH